MAVFFNYYYYFHFPFLEIIRTNLEIKEKLFWNMYPAFLIIVVLQQTDAQLILQLYISQQYLFI